MLLKNSLREGVLYSMAHVYVGRDSSANMKVGWGGGGEGGRVVVLERNGVSLCTCVEGKIPHHKSWGRGIGNYRACLYK